MISATLTDELAAFDRSMGKYIALSRRTPAEVVAQKGAQIIMGNQAPPFPGLYEELGKLTPQAGSITSERLAELRGTPRGVARPVKVRRRAKRAADELLAGRPSGLFAVQAGSRGRTTVRQVRFKKRGDSRIRSRSNRGGTVRVSARRDAASWERVLNRVSLSIALELSYRESGRGYIAVPFLPRRYRRMLSALRSATRRASAAQRRGVPIARSLATPSPMLSSDQLVRNASGDLLGRALYQTRADQDGALMRITGFTPPQARAGARESVVRVIRYVRADMQTYIHRKLATTRSAVGRFDRN